MWTLTSNVQSNNLSLLGTKLALLQDLCTHISREDKSYFHELLIGLRIRDNESASIFIKWFTYAQTTVEASRIPCKFTDWNNCKVQPNKIYFKSMKASGGTSDKQAKNMPWLLAKLTVVPFNVDALVVKCNTVKAGVTLPQIVLRLLLLVRPFTKNSHHVQECYVFFPPNLCLYVVTQHSPLHIYLGVHNTNHRVSDL